MWYSPVLGCRTSALVEDTEGLWEHSSEPSWLNPAVLPSSYCPTLHTHGNIWVHTVIELMSAVNNSTIHSKDGTFLWCVCVCVCVCVFTVVMRQVQQDSYNGPHAVLHCLPHHGPVWVQLPAVTLDHGLTPVQRPDREQNGGESRLQTTFSIKMFPVRLDRRDVRLQHEKQDGWSEEL